MQIETQLAVYEKQLEAGLEERAIATKNAIDLLTAQLKARTEAQSAGAKAGVAAAREAAKGAITNTRLNGQIG